MEPLLDQSVSYNNIIIPSTVKHDVEEEPADVSSGSGSDEEEEASSSNSAEEVNSSDSGSGQECIDTHLSMINVCSEAVLDKLITHPPEDDGAIVPSMRALSRRGSSVSPRDIAKGAAGSYARKPAPRSAFGKLHASLVECSQDAVFNLYFAKLLQAWGDRMWIFAIPILLMELRRDPVPALFFPALYGFCSGASTILFGPVMGEWVDHVSRIHAAKVVTVFQNGFIGLAGVLLATCIYYRDALSDWQLYLCVAALMILSFAANIFYAATVVILEKDWVAVLAGKDKSHLAGIISTIRRIELATNVLCPLVVAQLMTYAGKDVTALVIGIWSFVAIFTEYRAVRRTCLLAGECMIKSKKTKSARRKPLLRKLCKSCYAIYEGWRIFGRNKVCTAGLAVAFLEATVLIFSGVTNSYAVQQGFSSTTVALLAGGDALTGISATFVFPVIRKRISLTKIGLTAMVFHFLCGSVCVSSNWLPGSPFDPMFLLRNGPASVTTDRSYGVDSVTVLPALVNTTRFSVESPGNMIDLSFAATTTALPPAAAHVWTSLIVFSAGLTVGRFAFWMIDLTGSQILLESVQDEQRATICAVHFALKKLLNRVKYVMALFLAWPQTFGFLVIASQMFSLVGYGFFVVYCRKSAARKRASIVRAGKPRLSLAGSEK